MDGHIGLTSIPSTDAQQRPAANDWGLDEAMPGISPAWSPVALSPAVDSRDRSASAFPAD
jgi:hypothetical protein